MKLELEVLASTSIKRKKPWQRLAFLGGIQDSVFLLDDHRASVLYLPSGKTKKKIPKLHSILPDVVTLTHSDNGLFLAGLMRSGDLFLWHKDTDMLKFIPGLADLTQPTQTHTSEKQSSTKAGTTNSCQFRVHIADDGSTILVVDLYRVFVWELDPNQQLFSSGHNVIKGTWSRISPPDDSTVPDSQYPETSIHAVFNIREPCGGQCCVVSWVYNRGSSLCVTALVLSWLDVQHVFAYRYPAYTAEWSTILYPLSNLAPQAQPIRCPGAYVSQHSHDGNLLAVAVNQLNTYNNKIAFVSVWTDTVVVVDMKGMGTREPITRNARSYWAVDLHWTPDDLFVACVTMQGSLCILTRLGEPLLLQTFGCNIEMGPKHFLPLHPLISVRVESEDEAPQTEGEAVSSLHRELKDPLRQRFSVICHPDIPLLMVSDGYMVTAIQLPEEITCLSLIKGLVMESNRHLRRIRDQQKIQMTLFDSLKRQGVIGPKINMKTGRTNHRMGLLPSNRASKSHYTSTWKTSGKNRYTFEEEEEDTALDTTLDSEIADFILAGDVNVGKITFGDVDNLNATVEFDRFSQDEGLSIAEHILQAQRDLTLACSLAASHGGMWTSDHEEICHNVIHNIVRLFICILHSDSKVIKELNVLQGIKNKKKDKTKNRGFQKVLHLFQNLLHLLRLDSSHHHLQVCSNSLVHSMLELFLHNKDLHKKQSRLQTLHSCYVLLKYCDTMLGRLYVHLPVTSRHSGLSGHFSDAPPGDLYGPSVLSRATPSHHGKQAVTDSPHGDHYPDKTAISRGDAQVDDGYSSQPSARSVQSIAPEEKTYAGATVLPQKRFLPMWHLLHKYTVQHYLALSKAVEAHPDGDTALCDEISQTLRLLQLLQAKVHSLGGDMAVRRKVKLPTGHKLYIEGSTTPAISAWNHLLERMPDEKLCGGTGSRILHTLFYTLVLDDKLRSAITLVELLVRQTDLRKAVAICRQDDETKMSLLSLLQQMPDADHTRPVAMVTTKAARQVVQTLARLMGAYFSNQDLFVYPPHAARKIPPLHTQTSTAHRVLPLYHNKISSLVRHDDLGTIWTPERTLEYLLVGGLYPEAVWFVHKLGDWKTAFMMGVAKDMHRKICPEIYNSKKMNVIANLTPEDILKTHLKAAFLPSDDSINKGQYLVVDESTDFDQMTKTLSDVLLAASVCEMDVVPWLLKGLLKRLKSLAQKFYPLVPDGFYLPAPPVYCPQPALTDQDALSPDVLEEVMLRRETSSVLILIILVLNSSGTTLPAASWYAQKVLDTLTKGMRLKKQQQEELVLDIQVLQEAYLTSPSMFQGQEANSCIHSVLDCFRDLCSVTWMLYTRDKLSQNLRHKAKLTQQRLSHDEGVSDEEWHRHVRSALDWTLHLLPFGSYLRGENDLNGILLSVILELPQTADTAKLMAEHFPDPESCDPDIQEKVQWILKEWQGVFLKGSAVADKGKRVQSPRGTTMSSVFHSNIHRTEKIQKRRQKSFGKYDQQVFSGYQREEEEEYTENGITFVGSRYFESTEEYLQFLDVFYAVSFNRMVDLEREKQGTDTPNIPLLVQYTAPLRERELNSFASRAVNSVYKRQNSNKISIQLPKKLPSQTPISPRTKVTASAIPPSAPRSKGLFRSRSLTELHGREHTRYNSQSPLRRQISNSQDDLILHMPPSGKSGSRSPRGKKSIEDLSVADLGVDVHLPNKKNGILERSFSVSDLDDLNDKKQKPAQKMLDDPLSNPVMPEWMLDRMKFEKKYTFIEQMVEWVSRWAGRNHTLLSDRSLYNSDSSLDSAATYPSNAKPAIRVRVPPNMVMYSLWLLENCYDPPPSVRESAIPPQEIIVAAAHRNTPKKKDKKKTDKKKRKKEDNASDRQAVNSSNPRNLPKSPEKVEDATPSGARTRHEPRKLSFKLPGNPPDDQRSVGGASDVTEDTISVSSLHDEELRQTMAETMSKLQRSMHIDELDSSLPRNQRTGSSKRSTMESMNSTLHFLRSSVEEDRRADAVPKALTQSRSVQAMEDTAGSSRADSNRPGADSNASSIAQELQGIVRSELRRIMEAQHRGILAMLGALDDPNQPTDPLDRSGLSNGHIPSANTSTNGHSTRPKKVARDKSRDCVVLSVHEVDPQLEKKSHSSTDVEVTPLPSDESDKVLSMSDLEEITPIQAPQQQAVKQAKMSDGSGLSTALMQLKLLEGKHTDPSGQHVAHRDKENIPDGVPHGASLRGNHGDAQQPGQPFGRPMTLLKDANSDLSAVSWPMPGHPRLLQLQPERNEVPAFHLPHIPRPAWVDNSQTPQGHSNAGSISHMPPNQQYSGYRIEDVPEKDTNTLPKPPGHQDSQQPDSSIPFPLLRLNQPEPGPYGYNKDQFGIPRLIPPEDIILYEQHQYQQRALKKRQIRDFVNEQMSNQMAAQEQPETMGKKLLVPEMFEPFGTADERDKKQRERRRKKKAEASPAKVSSVSSPRSRKSKVKATRSAKVKDRGFEDADSTLTAGTDAESIVDEVASPVGKEPPVSPHKTSPKRVQVTSPRKEASPRDKDEEEAARILNHGYALTPGLFDEYLEAQDKLGSAADNNARVQYRATMGVQTTPRLHKRDAATDTATVDRGTSITKDTGTDPVGEAIQKYYRAKTGHTSTILPPDVYLGLRYEDTNKTTGSEGSEQTTRNFLNVVDINADVLDEIVSSDLPRPQTSVPAERSKVKLPSERARDHRIEKQLDDLVQDLQVPGPDRLTSGILGKPVSVIDSVAAQDALYSSRRVKSKDAIRKRLDDMNTQFNAIETMSSNIEQDFKNSNLLLHTIEQMGAAITPQGEPPSPRDVRPISPEPEAFRDYTGPKPSAVKRYRQDDRSPRKSGEKKEVMFEEDGLSPEQRVTDIRDQLRVSEDMDHTAATDSQALELSGLSGVSDIVGEMLAQGDLTAGELGLSKKQADNLADRALRSSRDGLRLSHEELEQIFTKSPRGRQKRTEEQRRELQDWMSKKHSERQQADHERRAQLREAERKPYESKGGSLKSPLNAKALHDKKKSREEDFARKREELASELMGDILADHPDLPKDLPPRVTREPASPRGKVTKATGRPGRGMEGKTVVRKVATAHPESGTMGRSARRTGGSPMRREKSPGDLDRMTIPVDDYMQLRDSHDPHVNRSMNTTHVLKPRPFAERVPPSDMEDHHYQYPEHRDTQQPAQPPTSHRIPKQKTLADIVRLQRPELSRKSRRAKGKPLTYTERLAELRGDGSTARSTGSTLRDKQRLYGSKHLPGSSPQSQRGAPRQVKTYTERLQDMKQSHPVTYHDHPPTQRPTTADTSRPASSRSPRRQDVTRQGITPRKPRRSLTYAEQLQQLQPPKDKYRGNETVTLHQGPPRKSHKPTHKPKTYVEQLRELQAPSSPRHSATYGPTELKRYRTQPKRSLVRSRPYADPYSELDDERLSVVSPWSVDDDVRKILYDDESGMPVRPASQATDLDMSELSDLDYFVGDDEYTAMVDVNDLAEVGSVSEGSIMSFIDWDQVDQIIAEAN